MKSNKFYLLICIIIIISVIYCGYSSYINDTDAFLCIDFADSLLIIIAIVVSYFALLCNDNVKNYLYKVENIINKIQNLVVNEIFNNIDKNKDEKSIRQRVLMNSKMLNNYIEVLKDYLNNNYKDDVSIIEVNFATFRGILDGYTNLDYLINSEEKIRNLCLNIDFACENLIKKMYIGKFNLFIMKFKKKFR